MIEEQYYSIKEISKMLKVAYLTVYRWVQAKKLHAVKAGKQHQISKHDLESFLSERKN